jgi:hypothetical protein
LGKCEAGFVDPVVDVLKTGREGLVGWLVSLVGGGGKGWERECKCEIERGSDEASERVIGGAVRGRGRVSEEASG